MRLSGVCHFAPGIDIVSVRNFATPAVNVIISLLLRACDLLDESVLVSICSTSCGIKTKTKRKEVKRTVCVSISNAHLSVPNFYVPRQFFGQVTHDCTDVDYLLTKL